MNRKIIPSVVFLLFTFSVVNIAFGMQQGEIADLQEKLKSLRYYSGEINGDLDEATMEAIKDCQIVCMDKEPERVDNITCRMVDKALKEQESTKHTDRALMRFLYFFTLLKQGLLGEQK